jgi:hydrogenase-1 operon protein HyaF
MAANFVLPPVGFGPGSQPEAGEEELEYVAMPSGMQTFHASIPYVDDPETVAEVVALLQALSQKAAVQTVDQLAAITSIDHLSRAALKTLGEILGEGEVAIKTRLNGAEAQESVFTGLWRVRDGAGEHLEIGAMARCAVVGGDTQSIDRPPLFDGVVNAPAILSEVIDHLMLYETTGAPHVINLTLLPHTPQDLDYLEHALGQGEVSILSRGYGNCRIDSCRHPALWHVRYYNSQDHCILDTIEITPMPEVACAATEDLADTAERLKEVAQAL